MLSINQRPPDTCTCCLGSSGGSRDFNLALFQLLFRDGPFDIQGGAGNLFLKKVCFPTGAKNKISLMKLKIKSLFFIPWKL